MYKTYKNTVIPHGHHIYAKTYDMEKANIYAYPHSDHTLPHCTFVLRCCTKFPCVNLPSKETYDQYSKTTPSISFHIYYLISCFTKNGRILLN